MRRPAITAFLLLFGCLTSAQEAPLVKSSVPLPGELTQMRQWAPGMVRCDATGNLFVVRSNHHELLKIGLNGGVALRIDVSGMANLGDARVVSFAPGPNDELYVLASHTKIIEVPRPDPDKPPRRSESWDLRATLLRFDANGALLGSTRMERFQMPWIAVFDSGDFLLVDGDWGKSPLTRIYSSDGKLLKEVDLAKTALAGHDSDGGETHLFSLGNKALIFLQWGIPEGLGGAAIATISQEGEVLRSLKIGIPKGYYVEDPRRLGEHLFGRFQLRPGGDPSLGEPYVDIDPQSGSIQRFVEPANRGFPACDTRDGMSFLNVRDQTLEVITLQPQK